MANYEVKFKDRREARTKTLRRAATLAEGQPFVARKILRGNRKGAWAKFQLVHGKIECLARQGEPG